MTHRLDVDVDLTISLQLAKVYFAMADAAAARHLLAHGEGTPASFVLTHRDRLAGVQRRLEDAGFRVRIDTGALRAGVSLIAAIAPHPRD